MQAKKRYLLLFVSCAFLAYCYFGGYRLRSRALVSEVHSLSEYNNVATVRTGHLGRRRKERRIATGTTSNNSNCRMETCFDFSRCRNEFKVYVHPSEESETPSASYQKLLNVLMESRYYTSEPSEACLFILGVDTLDRDRLSADYVRHLQARVQRLPLWNNGINHLVFNLYSGTWPDYTEHGLEFPYGRALLAKASMSSDHLRPGFDVSIPLFHKSHPEKGGTGGATGSTAAVNTDLLGGNLANNFPLAKTYLLAFKGKRYVHGIGSETRNALHHLHNGGDVVLVTTCRHGKSWKDMKDDRCDADNREYERYDYEVLLQNATFCLVPRGRRLGSFRFLEALQAGCIPVLLSNGWALPFAEVIDWSKAVVWADERLLLQVPNTVRSITATKILELRQQTQILWDRYFSSIEKIVYTTLEIIRERLPHQPRRDGLVWNTAPGAILTLPHFSDTPRDYPFGGQLLTTSPTSVATSRFTAVVYCQLGGGTATTSNGGGGGGVGGMTTLSPLYRLVSNVIRSRYIHRVLIVWANDKRPPSRHRWSQLSGVPVHVILPGAVGNTGAGFYNSTSSTVSSGGGVISSNAKSSISQRFYPHPLIETAAVLSLDEDSVLTTDEVDFAFRVWRAFPDRIVGYPARSHYWDDAKSAWGYTSKWTNDYSIVLTGAAFYHRYYGVLYTEWLSPLLHKTVDQSQNCEDILMNFLVSHVTRRPPIKVTQRKQYKETAATTNSNSNNNNGGGNVNANGNSNGNSPWNDPDHFIQRQTCLNTFAAVFGYMPLVRSSFRLDPVLFKDPVSNMRKKYRQIELVGS